MMSSSAHFIRPPYGRHSAGNRQAANAWGRTGCARGAAIGPAAAKLPESPRLIAHPFATQNNPRRNPNLLPHTARWALREAMTGSTEDALQTGHSVLANALASAPPHLRGMSRILGLRNLRPEGQTPTATGGRGSQRQPGARTCRRRPELRAGRLHRETPSTAGQVECLRPAVSAVRLAGTSRA